MASSATTKIPQDQQEQQQQQQLEREPLLGQQGDVTQEEGGVSVYQNLFSGSAAVAQAGILILIALVWSGILSHPLIFFSPHPLLNTTALLLQLQATLILQPTSTPPQKRQGTKIHYTLQTLSVLAFLSGLVIIEINKGDHPRFTSPHGVLGLITYVCIVLQAVVGVVQYFLPQQVLGSVEAGKKVYKYHRGFGYALLVLELGTVSAATLTTYNVSILRIPVYPVVGAGVVLLLGVAWGVRRHKLGL